MIGIRSVGLQDSNLLERGLTSLGPRERRILVERRLSDEPLTLQELGDEYGISRERVRQIEKHALGKLEDAVREEARALNG